MTSSFATNFPDSKAYLGDLTTACGDDIRGLSEGDILGVFGGFIVFGFLGLFIGPTLIAVMFTLLTAWRVAVADHPAVQPAKRPA